MAVTAHASGTKTATLGTFTVTIASPGVFTYSGNELANGDAVVLSTTGALPTGLTAGTTYYVVNNATDGSGKFRLSATAGGSDINTSGSQSGTHSIVTEHFLSGPNVAGTFQVVVDTVNLAANDVLELRVYQMVLTGGTARIVYFASFADAQPTDDLIKVSVPVSNELTDTNALRFSLRQTYGTARAFPWKVLKFA